MTIDLADPRLTRAEQAQLRRIASRLSEPRQPLPDYLKAEVERVFGGCEEGDLSARGYASMPQW